MWAYNNFMHSVNRLSSVPMTQTTLGVSVLKNLMPFPAIFHLLSVSPYWIKMSMYMYVHGAECLLQLIIIS